MTNAQKTLSEQIDTDPLFALQCLLYLYDQPTITLSPNLNRIARLSKNGQPFSASHHRLVRMKIKQYLTNLNNIELPATSTNQTTNQFVTLASPKTLAIYFDQTNTTIRSLIKTKIFGRKHQQSRKDNYWSAPIIHDNIKLLKENNFLLSPDVEAIWDAFYPKPVTLPKDWPVYPYQHTGVEFLVGTNGRGIIADDMGLGKTIQALYWIHHAKIKPILVLMPKSTKLNWEQECHKWLPTYTTQVVHGRTNKKLSADIVLANYDILFDTIEIEKKVKKMKQGVYIWSTKKVKIGTPRTPFLDAQFSACIVDEFQNFKNENARRTQALKTLVKDIPHLVGLSGTPIKNRPIEFFAFLNMVDNKKWPNKFAYATKYCAAKKTYFGWDFSGASNLDLLNKKLKGTMIRRLKSDVLDDLPPKTRSVIPLNVEKSVINDYIKAEEQLKNALLTSDKRAAQLSLIGRLKQLAADIKLPACVEWIEDYLQINTKLVVFCHHKTIIQRLCAHFNGRCVHIIGGDSAKKRQDAITMFQNNPDINLFIGSIQATKEGITLTAAKDTVTLEFVWEPTDHLQAEDRVHRIGQKENVHAYYLVLPHSIELHIARLLDTKINIISQIIDGKEAKKTDLFLEILKLYKKDV